MARLRDFTNFLPGRAARMAGWAAVLFMLALFMPPCALAAPKGEPAQAPDGISGGQVVIKDVSVFPEQAPGDGSGRVRVSCTVFSANEQSRITRVFADMGHTITLEDVEFRPDPRNFLESGEGRYIGVLDIGPLTDPGRYTIPISASDSMLGSGAALGFLDVEFRRSRDLSPPGTRGFMEALQEAAGSSLEAGNKIEFLDDGSQALNRRLELMEGAAIQINLETYTFDTGMADGRIMDLLLKKAQQGVEVNIILNAGSQVPTSPLGVLRLELDQWMGRMMEKAEQNIDANGKTGSMVQNLLSRSPGRGVNVIMASSRELEGGKPRGANSQRPLDHWLSRVVEAKNKAGGGGAPPVELKEKLEGPGGLPALPLLDFAVHEKILVVDGAQAIVGGRNLEDRYFKEWRDLDVHLEGPVVSQVQQGFLRTYEDLRSADLSARPASRVQGLNPPAGAAPALFVQSKPWERDFKAMKAMVTAIESSTEKFYAVSQYIALPPCLLRDAIVDAARRGVDVRILTNSLESSSGLYFSAGYFVTLNSLEDLLEAGVRVFETTVPPDAKTKPYCHVKEFLFDSRVAAAGSFNLSLRSCYVESENLVFVDDPALCKAREKAFLETLETGSREILLQDLPDLKTRYKSRVEAAQYLNLVF